MKLVLVLLALLALLALITIYTALKAPPVKAKPSTVTDRRRQKKSVTFNSNVSVKRINGDKSERYNPDLKDCVKRNTMQAMSVGGMKALAAIDLR